MPDTVRTLATGRAPGGEPAPGGGRDGRYLVLWSDTLAVGSAGFGLLLELERAGFDVGASDGHEAAVVPHRVLDRQDATAIVLLARGETAIEVARAAPGVVEVAYEEPRSAAQVARYDELEAEVVSELRAAGLDDLVGIVERSVFMAALDERFPPHLREVTTEMISLGQPSAVLVGPPSAGPAMLSGP